MLGAAVLLIGILGAAYAIDPYDTGRSGLLKKPGVRPQGPRTANASRGRDPAFNAAVSAIRMSNCSRRSVWAR